MSTELKRIYDFALFAHVVETGSISRCASRLGFERSTVSRRISGLEAHLGIRLLERTTRYVTVTDAGRRCYEQCSKILRAAQDAQSMATNGAVSSGEGPVRVAAPVCVVESFLGPMLENFRVAHPEINIELKLVDHWSDDVVASHDVAIALGPLSLKRTWQKKAAALPQMICASPAFLAKHAIPDSVESIELHDCIVDEATKHDRAWKLRRSDTYARFPIYACHTVPNLLQVRQAAIAGLGLACLPIFMCEHQMKSGELVLVLPEYDPLPRDLLLLSPKSSLPKRNPTALRVHLEKAFKSESSLNSERSTGAEAPMFQDEEVVESQAAVL